MSILPQSVLQPNDSEGRTYPLGKLYTYDAGTYTQRNTFSDSALTTPNSWPVVADGAGRFFNVFLNSGTYRIELRDVNGVVIWEQDDVAAPVDGTDLTNLETEIDQNKVDITKNIASYDEDSVGPSATAYTLSIKGGLSAPNAYIEGMKIIFSPQITNSGTSTTVNVEGLGAKGLRQSDGTSTIAANYFDTSKNYCFQYEGSIFRFLWESRETIDTAQLEDGAVTTVKHADNSVNAAKLATLGAGNLFAGDSSGDPAIQSYIYQWQYDDSGNLTSGATYDVEDIPASAIEIKISFRDVTSSSTSDFCLQLGYGATPTYLATGYSGATNVPAGTTTAWSTRAIISTYAGTQTDLIGQVVLRKMEDNIWQISVENNSAAGGVQGGGCGFIDVAAELTAIRFSFVNGTDTFADGYISTHIIGNANV